MTLEDFDRVARQDPLLRTSSPAGGRAVDLYRAAESLLPAAAEGKMIKAIALRYGSRWQKKLPGCRNTRQDVIRRSHSLRRQRLGDLKGQSRARRFVLKVAGHSYRHYRTAKTFDRGETFAR